MGNDAISVAISVLGIPCFVNESPFLSGFPLLLSLGMHSFHEFPVMFLNFVGISLVVSLLVE